MTPHFGLEADPSAIDRMVEESRFYAKDRTRRIFTGDMQRHAITDEMPEAAMRFAEPGYRALASHA